MKQRFKKAAIERALHAASNTFERKTASLQNQMIVLHAHTKGTYAQVLLNIFEVEIQEKNPRSLEYYMDQLKEKPGGKALCSPFREAYNAGMAELGLSDGCK